MGDMCVVAIGGGYYEIFCGAWVGEFTYVHGGDRVEMGWRGTDLRCWVRTGNVGLGSLVLWFLDLCVGGLGCVYYYFPSLLYIYIPRGY